MFVCGHQIPNSNAPYLCHPAFPGVPRNRASMNSGHENATNVAADHDEELDAFTFARFEVCFAATP